MLLHPTTVILLSITMLIISFKNNYVFRVISILFPIFAAFIFFNFTKSNEFFISNLTFSYKIDYNSKMVCSAFFCVLFAANLYSLGQGKKLEVIYGSAYCAFAMLCSLANDFLSMFVGLELMMICSSIIIFIGQKKDSFRTAKKYFITHLVSSNMIIIGLTYLISKNNDLTITEATNLLNNNEYSFSILLIMLTGMFINIAPFPFSGWMVNYYTKASPSGFIYLISFTTKVSIFLLLKIFPGLEILKYIAMIMIVYSSFKATKEANLFSLLCYLSIIAMGLMLIGISIGTKEALSVTIFYLFLHIIYKLLLSISVAVLMDQGGVEKCQNLAKIQNNFLFLSICLGMAMMLSLPLSSTFYAKTILSYLAEDKLDLFNLTFLSFTTAYLIPWRQYINSKKTLNFDLNIYAKISLLFSNIILISSGFFYGHIFFIGDISSTYNISLIGYKSIKQILIILSAIIMAYLLFKSPKKLTKPINLIEYISDFVFRFYTRNINKKSKNITPEEPWNFKSLEIQMINKIQRAHTQSVAIFIVFSILIIMLIGFL